MAKFELLRRRFLIRRFEPDEIVDGYAVANYMDITTKLNVQPLNSDESKALPEGERRVKRMKAYGDLLLAPADQSTGRRGDWLYYKGSMDPDGHWYECVSCTGHDHTILAHCKSEFVQVSDTEAARYPFPSDAEGVYPE